jgi:hypothetical protein
MWIPVNCWTYLCLFAREVVVRLHEALDACIEVAPAGIVGADNGELEAGRELQADVYLAVFAGVVGGDVGADGCGEFFAEA